MVFIIRATHIVGSMVIVKNSSWGFKVKFSYVMQPFQLSIAGDSLQFHYFIGAQSAPDTTKSVKGAPGTIKLLT